MKYRNKLFRLFVLLLAAVMLLSSCTAGALEIAKRKKKNRNTPTPAPAVTEAAPATEGAEGPQAEPTATPEPMGAAQELADYLFEHGELPENFVTKKEAMALGWQTIYRNPGDIPPGMTIGGDYFGNYQQKLPVVKGRKYYEADCYYNGGRRNEYRIIYSTDGHVWYTGDHYVTFIELFPSEKE